MELAELSQEDQALALDFLKKKKKKEEYHQSYQHSLAIKIKAVYDMLEIPYGDKLIITSFVLARTIIWAHEVRLRCDYEEMFAHTSKYQAENIGSGFTREKLTYRAKHQRVGKDIYNNITAAYCNHEPDRKVHNLYVNQIHICPFCAIPEDQPDKVDWKHNCITQRSIHWNHPHPRYSGYPKWSWDGGRIIKKSDFYTSPIQYHRCRSHGEISRKQYLEGWKTNRPFGDDDLERKALLDAIYPPKIKYTKKYYAEKRVKKVIRKRLLTKSEVAFFSMLLGVNKLKKAMQTPRDLQ